MAPAVHAIESALDVPTPHPPRVRIKNRLVGIIVARCTQFPNYPRVKYHVRMPDGGAISFVSAPLTEQSDGLDIGQQVTLDILPSDVMLSPPRWLSHLEDNHWPGRVVLAANQEFESLVVVKILGRFWTLTSTRNTSWLDRPPRAWDRVTVHIPLDAILIRRRYPGHPHLRPRLLTEVTGRDATAVPPAHDEANASGMSISGRFSS
jgi:hypothetical protein